MRFKVDENLPLEVAKLLGEAGHDSLTVLQQALGGETDAVIATVCLEEQRALITLDVDFADIRAYPPERFPGIIVLRLKRQDRASILAAVKALLPILEQEALEKRLWIVEPDRIRIREVRE